MEGSRFGARVLRVLAMLVLGAALQATPSPARQPPSLETSELPETTPDAPEPPQQPLSEEPAADACDYGHLPAVVWWGPERHLPLERLAAYLAPVFWFSPDEPLLEGREGADIRIPEPFPFEEEADAPVVYYQLDELVGAEGAYQTSDTAAGGAVVDLSQTQAFSMSYLAYFRSEEGLGAHPHDLEPAEFKAVVLRTDSESARRVLGVPCEEPGYLVLVTRVTGQAHGLVWFWNVLEVDEETHFPMHLMVEEGKHALAPDKNGDGYFTPGYDANERINDAWGVRDVIRSGTLFSGGYQSWMTKVRRPEHQVLPPLPEDSPLRTRETRDERALNLVEYELRRYPSSEQAEDEKLRHLMAWREIPGWPELVEAGSVEDLTKWVDAGRIVKSLSIALMLDGNVGFSFVFPFLLVKNLEDPVGGGFVVWRMYLSNRGRDLGWMLMYTPSASRWFDTYLAAGAEWEYVAPDDRRDLDFVLESGLKLRVNLVTTPFRFLGFLTDFWGLRIGVRNRGFFRIDELTYVIELGAGVW